MSKILLTGGLGYIGSHTAVALIAAGYEVVIVDNLINSQPSTLDSIAEIAGTKPAFYELDLRDKLKLSEVFEQNEIEAVIHFASLKAVGESVQKPLEYYDNNIGGATTLFQLMNEHEVHKLIFSSSATVYGDPLELPINESHPANRATNPYGQTKVVIEQIIRDWAVADKGLCAINLRYFNPIGAHESGKIGENPNGIPNNLLPYVAQVAAGKLDTVRVFGDDYDTPDGTGVRDYIHVVDLAEGHVKALEHLRPGCDVFNLGTSRGYSVLELIRAFEKASGKKIPYEVVARRPGDIAECYADATKANNELGWSASRTLEQGCEDSWHWQQSLTTQTH